MRRDEFPPIIANGKPNKLVMADGNHRLEGAIRSKKPVRTYHIIDTPSETILSIMYERNAKHGLKTSEEERIQQALNLIERGMDIPTAAAVTSLPKRVLTKASAQRTADLRFLEAGLPAALVDKISEPIKRRLAQVYTDEGFIPLVHLTVAAHVHLTEPRRPRCAVLPERALRQHLATFTSRWDTAAARPNSRS